MHVPLVYAPGTFVTKGTSQVRIHLDTSPKTLKGISFEKAGVIKALQRWFVTLRSTNWRGCRQRPS